MKLFLSFLVKLLMQGVLFFFLCRILVCSEYVCLDKSKMDLYRDKGGNRKLEFFFRRTFIFQVIVIIVSMFVLYSYYSFDVGIIQLIYWFVYFDLNLFFEVCYFSNVFLLYNG